MAIKLDGDALATEIKADLRRRIEALASLGVTPGLGTVLVGDDAPSANYVAMKHRDCAELGIASYNEHLPGDANGADVVDLVERLNAEPGVDGFLLQYPFPPHLDYAALAARVDPAKDADGLHPVNLGRLVIGVDGPRPCTPVGIQRLLAHYAVPVEGRHVVVIGRGLTIGRPLAALLSLKEPHANAAVTVVHTGVADLAAHTRRADVIVAAAGAPGVLTADMVRPGAAVVAAGVRHVDGRILSDVELDVRDVAGWMTPRLSGGVGSMTRVMLLSNAVEAAERRAASMVADLP